jgi:hypothetical protein
MDGMSFELCRQLVIPYTPSGFDPSLVSRELLCYTLGHDEPDCREISLYVVDDYHSATGQREEQVFSSAPERLRNDLFHDSLRRFSWGSRLSSSSRQNDSLDDDLVDLGQVERVNEIVKEIDMNDGRVRSRLREHSEKRHPGKPQPTYDEDAWLPESSQPTAEVILVVHGTWASSGWWLPGSPFIAYLDSVTSGAVYKQSDQFQWTGRNLHSHRLHAGSMLANWLDRHPHVTTIVAHSHGGNVVTWASRVLSLSSKHHIGNVILLGTPSRMEYTPSLRIIENLSNVYSFADFAQTPAGTAPHRRGEGRTVSDSQRTLNVLAVNRWFGPSHTDLHEPSVWQTNRLDRFL